MNIWFLWRNNNVQVDYRYLGWGMMEICPTLVLSCVLLGYTLQDKTTRTTLTTEIGSSLNIKGVFINFIK